MSVYYEEGINGGADKQSESTSPAIVPVETNLGKMEAIRSWIHPEERISLDFEDAVNLNAEVLDCTEQVVTLRLEASGLELPHHYQEVGIPLREVTVTEDPTRYTRNPDTPIRYGRLKLIVHSKRPAIL